GGTVAITNNYSTIGALNLTNGATVNSTGTGGGNYYGFQLRGNVISGGSSPSTISGTRDYHLNVNTTFDVENTGGSPADLVVSANLRNLSGDFGNAAGSLTKIGPGTMMLTGAANVFSGSATINAGILQIGDGTANNGSMAAYIDDEALLIFANPTAWTYTNYIVGAGNVIKTGAGMLTLSANSYYTGSTVISNGVVNFSSPQSISGSIAVNDGSTLAVSASSDANYLSPSSVTVGNSTGGTLQFSLAGSITGPTANTLLTPGSLTLNGTTAIVISHCPQSIGSYPLFNGYNGTSPLTLASQPAGVLGQITATGGVVYYQVTNTVTDVWTSQVDTNWDTVTANWTNNLQATTYSQGDPVQFDDTANGASPLTVNIVGSVSPNAITVSNMSKAYVIGGQAIAGVTGLTKAGSDSLTLTGTNTFTGDLAILGGTLAIGNGGGGQLGAGAYAGNIDDEALLQYNSSSAQTLSGIISGPGALVVTNGTLTLNGANTYNGGTTLGNGTIVFGNGNALGAGTVTTTGGTLKWIYVSGNTILTNNLAVNGPTTLDVAGGNWTMNGNLTGSGAITRGTAATLSLYLGGDNSGYTGTFTDPANGNAVVRFSSATAGSANARWVFNQNVSGRLSLFSGTMNFGSMTGSGFVQQATTGTTVLQAGALGLNDVFSGVMQQANAGDILVFAKVGPGRMTLSGANTYAGGTIISNGVLCVSNSAALSSSGNITFGGGTLQYSGVNAADYSTRIANSTAPISIDLDGANVTYASALPSSNTG
ncbi:MAG TPA: autotransporter-associated beta strand repeat-containing protein, partial [Verrucomicrobiae bacterium]|nr:autotransporter-associated beta strand repeat-containing protein [Verrucomicrobiae bacterium]